MKDLMVNKDLCINNISKNIKYVPGFDILRQVLERSQGFKFYIAGGAIRNLIKQIPGDLNDIDVFVDLLDNTSSSFEEILNTLSKYGYLEFGQYGAPRWFPVKNSKLYYDIIPFSKFNVGFGTPNTIESLLSQFDFTANAIAYNILSSELHDPINGLTDLKDKIFKHVRLDFPDEIITKQIPLQRLTVLWFRFIHYSSKLNFEINENTLNWLYQNSYRIKDIDLFEKHFFKPILNKALLKIL